MVTYTLFHGLITLGKIVLAGFTVFMIGMYIWSWKRQACPNGKK